MTATALRKRVAEPEIEMLGVLPRWRDDDARFIAKHLTVYGRDPVQVARVVRDLGLNDRNEREDGPSIDYQRVRAALRRAVREGLLRQRGKKYGLP